MSEVKTVCPFCDYIPECTKPNCTGCPIRIENATKINEQIAKAMKDYWAHQRGGAE